jgi:hypothetical protein
VATFTAFASSVIFEKLHFMATFGTFFLKNGFWLPVSAVLSRAFHFFPSSIFYILTGFTGFTRFFILPISCLK